MTERAFSSIVVRDRHRRDFSGVAVLVESIKRVGLLQPPGITPEGTLLWGECRLRACRQLGWEMIPVIVRDVDPDDIVAVEAAENFARKNFTPSEAVSIRRSLEPKMKAEAERRMKAGTPSENFSKGRAADHASATTGYSRVTLDRAEVVVDAANDEPDNEKFGKALADMNRTGRVDGPYKRVKVARQAAAIRNEAPPLPHRGPYRVIVADPPWPYDVRAEDPSHRAAHPYTTMSIASICAFGATSIAHEDAILWLWTTNHHMRESYAVLDAWGFRSATILTWAKNRFGTGDWLRGQTEHCHLAVRGNPVVELTNQSTVLFGPIRAHSQKPDEFYPFVEGLCAAPRYASLFHRGGPPNERWDVHGDEVPPLAAECA